MKMDKEHLPSLKNSNEPVPNHGEETHNTRGHFVRHTLEPVKEVDTLPMLFSPAASKPFKDIFGEVDEEEENRTVLSTENVLPGAIVDELDEQSTQPSPGHDTKNLEVLEMPENNRTVKQDNVEKTERQSSGDSKSVRFQDQPETRKKKQDKSSEKHKEVKPKKGQHERPQNEKSGLRQQLSADEDCDNLVDDSEDLPSVDNWFSEHRKEFKNTFKKKRPMTPEWTCYDPEVTSRLREKYTHLKPLYHQIEGVQLHGAADIVIARGEIKVHQNTDTQHDNIQGWHQNPGVHHGHGFTHTNKDNAHLRMPDLDLESITHDKQHHVFHIKSHENAEKLFIARSSSHEHLPSIIFREENLNSGYSRSSDRVHPEGGYEEHVRPTTEGHRKKSHSFSSPREIKPSALSAGHRHVANIDGRHSKLETSKETKGDKKKPLKTFNHDERSVDGRRKSYTNGEDRGHKPPMDKRHSLWGNAKANIDMVRRRKSMAAAAKSAEDIAELVVEDGQLRPIEFEARWSKTNMITSRAANGQGARILDNVDFWRKFPPRHSVFQLEDPSLKENTFVLKHDETEDEKHIINPT